MCGRLNITDDLFVNQLLLELGVESPTEKMRYGRFIRATNTVSILRETDSVRELTPATWWLLLEPTAEGFKPSKYTSFNTRYDKLSTLRSAGYKPYRESRCVIVAKGFGETEYQNKKPLHYHDFEAIDGAIAFGGLYKEWFHKATGEVNYSCSVITLPPHEKLMPYHSKASPMMLPQDDTIDAWLDPHNKNVDMFQHLLEPAIHNDLIVQQIDKPSSYRPIGEPGVIKRDIA